MRTVVNVLAVVGLANVLAIGGFVGWLYATDRLSSERLTTLRATITRPIAVEKKDAEDVAAKVAAEMKKAEDEARMSKAPLTAEQQLEARLGATALDRQKAERLDREIADLRAQLGLERVRLEKDRAELTANKAAFDAFVKTRLASTNDEQAKKTLAAITAMDPETAVGVFKAMIVTGAAPVFAAVDGGPVANGAPMSVATEAPEPGLRQVVGYLDAMKAGPRNEILAAFAETDPALATRLLNELRTRAEFVRVP